MPLPEFQHAFLPLVFGVVAAIILSFFLHETGSVAGAAMSQKPKVVPAQ